MRSTKRRPWIRPEIGHRWGGRLTLDRAGDALTYGLTALAGAAAVALVGAIAYKIFDGAWPAITHFGISFLWRETWDPIRNVFGAAPFLYGTALTSFCAVLLAGPISIAIG